MSLDVYLNIDECPMCKRSENVYHANITHNLNRMADAAGIYEALWRPEEICAVYAKDIETLVKRGLSKLKRNPEKYKKFNASNGWGTYEHFVEFVEEYYFAIKRNPESKIEVSR